MSPTLSTLAASGILERTAPRPGMASELRVSPRFLAYAEGTAGRLRVLGRVPTPQESLEAAIHGWDEFSGDARRAATLLASLLGDAHQLGALAPVFPSLDMYAAA